MRLIRTPDQLRAHAARVGPRPGGVLVPTMGALHAGHEALIRLGVDAARQRGCPAGCVVTIFVNPAQFDEPHDYERYPRVLDDDAAICEACGAHAVVAPSVDMVYPAGPDAPGPPVPDVAVGKGLEDRFRPGHFRGVARVLDRLFALVPPEAAVFGEKDWQQLQLARDLVDSLGLGIDVLAAPTVRDPDGLALSSRNRFLSQADRQAAAAIPRALRVAGEHRTLAEAEHAMGRALEPLAVEYATIRHARTLAPLPATTTAGAVPARSLIACRLGATRLLDNAPWPLPSASALTPG